VQERETTGLSLAVIFPDERRNNSAAFGRIDCSPVKLDGLFERAFSELGNSRSGR